MLRDHPSLAIGFIQFTFEPSLDNSSRTSLAGAAVQSILHAKDWKLAPGTCLIDDKSRLSFFGIDPRRLQYQSLGVKVLFSEMEIVGQAFESALKVMGITEIQTVRMQIHAFFPFGMTHAEIVKLCLDEFFQPTTKFENLIGKPHDLLFQLYGTRNRFDTRLSVYPMTTEQVRLTATSFPNLDQFGRNDCFDPTVREFVDSIARDCCSIDVEVSSNRTETNLTQTLAELLKTIDSIMTETIKLLKAFK